MAEQRHISVPKPFSSGDVSEWLRRFEICSKANKWNEETQALKLPTLLEGEALAVWLELSEEEQSSMETIKRKLKEKMMPMKFISLGQFHARKLHPGEPLSVFTHDLKQLLEQAVPDLTDATAKGQLYIAPVFGRDTGSCQPANTSFRRGAGPTGSKVRRRHHRDLGIILV